jgi:ABC-type sulfate transport system permease component
VHDDLLPALPAGFVTNLISPQASTLYKVLQSTEVAIFMLGVSFFMFCSVRLWSSKTVSEPKVDM